MTDPAHRQGRLGAALAVVTILICGMVSAFNMQRALELEALTGLDRGMLRQITQRLEVENTASSVRQTRNWDHLLIRETTPALAEATLHRHAFAIVEQAGGQTRQSGRGQPLDPQDSDKLVNLIVVFDGPIETVQRVLFDLERSTPAILINKLDIEPSLVVQPTEVQRLQVTMQLTAQWREP